MAEESRPGQSGPGDEELIEFGPPARRRARRKGRALAVRGGARQRIALGALGFLAVGAAGGLLVKYAFAGPGAPSHKVVAPQAVDGYARSANLEKQLNVTSEARQVAKADSGKASGVVAAVYQPAAAGGAGTQMFIFLGGELASANPGTSMASFERAYPRAATVPAGSLGGQAACTETGLEHSASMCVWYDGDTFGTLQSPTMTAAKLAVTMDAVRPGLELDAGR